MDTSDNKKDTSLLSSSSSVFKEHISDNTQSAILRSLEAAEKTHRLLNNLPSTSKAEQQVLAGFAEGLKGLAEMARLPGVIIERAGELAAKAAGHSTTLESSGESVKPQR